MCGRVAVYRPVDVLAGAFGARVAPGVVDRYEPGYNLAPTRTLPGLTGEHGPVLDLFHWGLANRSFNARAERLAAGHLRRLAVVVDGFFEWHDRQPLFFTRTDGAPLCVAGRLEGRHACTMITTAAGPDLEGIHGRMPAVLEADDLAPWLGGADLSRRQVAKLLRPAPAGTLTHHPVHPKVGDVRNDSPDVIVRFDPPVEALRLFG